MAITLTKLLPFYRFLASCAEESFVVSKKSFAVAADVLSSALADVPLIPVPEVARREGITKAIVLRAAATLGIAPLRTASNRDRLTFNQAVRIIEHLHRVAAQQPS